ncbi:MAG: glycosyltransferase family 4 protein [Deltaproteobacteria bacterium]|nr:glycosyltransferase family 4 protein [Deltaproteobacteria bacterium]
MDRKKIISPIAWGSGAYIVHKLLEGHVEGYKVYAYNPYWALCPFLLRIITPVRGAHVIHTTADYASFFHKESIPLVITFHNYVLDRWMRSYSSFAQVLHYSIDLRLWVRLAVQRARVITAVSRFTANLVKRDLDLANGIKVIYNGVDVDRFKPCSRKNSSSSTIKVLFSGNLSRRKGAQWLPLIAKGLDKGIRIFCTQGLQARKILQSHPNLECIGPVPFKNMPDRYREMDILLMPTVREGLSLAVLEAMASGLPVVASNCSSLPEQIDDGKGGFLCPLGDAKSFAEKINTLAESPRLRKEMGEYNRSKTEQSFTLNRMVNEYRDLFEEIIG